MIGSRRLVPAAVILPIVVPKEKKEQKWTARVATEIFSIPAGSEVLFTVRTHTVISHRGQIAFPGGVIEDNETPQEAALREMHEELGVSPEQVSILGPLPPVPTLKTHFTIYPFVGSIQANTELRPNTDEIDEIFTVPIDRLLRPEGSIFETYEHEGIHYRLKSYLFEQHRIWGATARILQTFLERHLEV